MKTGYGRNYHKSFPIYRMKEKELNDAIEELESRGYELVKRGSESKEHKFFNRNGSDFGYRGSETQTKHWAVMKRVVPI